MKNFHDTTPTNNTTPVEEWEREFDRNFIMSDGTSAYHGVDSKDGLGTSVKGYMNLFANYEKLASI